MFLLLCQEPLCPAVVSRARCGRLYGKEKSSLSVEWIQRWLSTCKASDRSPVRRIGSTAREK